MGGKYVVSCIARAANSSSSFLLHSTAAGDDPDADGLTYPEPVFLHFTDGQQLILLDVGNLELNAIRGWRCPMTPPLRTDSPTQKPSRLPGGGALRLRKSQRKYR